MAGVEMKKDSKIYVAGHRGLLGSAVKRKLEKDGHTNLLLRTSAELDLTDQLKTYEFLEREKPEFVFVCAAKVGGIQANINAPAEFLFDNLQIQNNLIDGAYRAGVKKLLFVGSSCIYPKVTEVPIKEKQLLSGYLEESNEGYALAKITGIRMGQFYRRQYGCDFISALPTNLYGISDNYDLTTSHMLPAIIRKVHEAKLKGTPFIEVWGTGKPRREFMLSDDCADALVFLMRNYSAEEPVNVGLGYDKTILELVDSVIRVLDAKVQIKMDSSKPDGMMRKMLDMSKLTGMGWKPQHTLEEGIAIAYEDFRQRFA